MDLNRLFRAAVELDASDLHLKVGQPPIVRSDGDLGRSRARRRSLRSSSRRSCGRSAPIRGTARGFERDRRARHGLPAARPAALPRERLPPARRDLVRVPRHPERGAELRGAPAAARASSALPRPPGPHPRHRRHRLGQDDDARVRNRPHQRSRHSTSSRSRTRSRSCTPTQAAWSTSARSGSTRIVPRGAPPRAPPGSRRDPDR